MKQDSPLFLQIVVVVRKRMYIGKQFKRMTDGKHTIEIVDGYGEFICDAASLNLYVVIY